MSSTTEKLMEIYRAARERFGHQGWWPGETPLEICVGAILTQNTNWTNVEKAIANLKAADRMSVARLAELSHEALAELVRPAGYFNVKARRLMNFIERVQADVGDDLDAFLDRSVSTLREELLSIKGIGRETADSIALYAAKKRTFVVDTYTYRILFRHGIIDAESDYESIKELMELYLPDDIELYSDFHAQLVAVGKHFCKPRPKCDGCPLQPLPHDPLAGTESR